MFNSCQDEIIHRSIPSYWHLCIMIIGKEEVEDGLLQDWSDMEMHQR